MVAPQLIGWTLSHAGVSLEIVETEAYSGALDLASHARSGPTARSAAMFGPVDRAYLYRSYGVHVCFNVVCHQPEGGGAVLIRAGRVTLGQAIAKKRRGDSRGLADGPGKLGQTLALDLTHDGTDLRSGPIRLTPPGPKPKGTVISGPRIGITRSLERPHRFWLEGCPEVSRR